MSFKFVDLFAGIGGFHAALSATGGECNFVSEIDRSAAAIYQLNWGGSIATAPGRPQIEGDIIPLTESRMAVPAHDVLCGGFPCQPFSKSGFQLGMAEARGTLFWNICRILEKRRPRVILLENVRNIAGPRHHHEWEVIIRSLRELGYRVSHRPTIFSPHLLPKEMGGTPQVRERVFILGTYVGKVKALKQTDIGPVVPHEPVVGWDPMQWDLEHDLLQPDNEIEHIERYRLTPAEEYWIECWDDFVQRMLEIREGERLPGFPIWADELKAVRESDLLGLPTWKSDFLRKNSRLYKEHRELINAWRARFGNLEGLPPSRRKLEWQAQDAGSLWETVMHFRPSGIRAKRPTYLPALVAVTQTSIIGWRHRRITPREAARLQGLPDWFNFGDQSDTRTYKQLGNGVAVGAAYHVFRTHVINDQNDLPEHIVSPVMESGERPIIPRPTSLAHPRDDNPKAFRCL
jgi:DNA (cytosine-5)-methyltransferase 1